MDWQSLYGSTAEYEERLREVARENYARRVWANNHRQGRWSVTWHKWICSLLAWLPVRERWVRGDFGKLTMSVPEQKR
jgi:hypothetical protein